MLTLAVFAGILGAIVGSFLNVVIYRLPRGEPLGLVRQSRSQCPSCGGLIHWYDNLPLLSFLLLGGRCRVCRARISWRYPAVELLTALLFALTAFRVGALGWRPPLVAFLVVAAFLALLVAAAGIDFSHRLLPDALTVRSGPLIGLAGALAVPALHGTAVFGWDLAGWVKPGLASLGAGIAGLVVGGGVIWTIRALGTLVMRREAMGFGDVKFMACCGLLLGPGGALLAIGTGLVAGSVLGLGIWAIHRRREIPFGPFLALGAAAALLYGHALRVFLFEVYPSWFHSG